MQWEPALPNNGVGPRQAINETWLVKEKVMELWQIHKNDVVAWHVGEYIKEYLEFQQKCTAQCVPFQQ